MKKLGLALSGGFRASLYHLGLLRFLRDADLLSQVTHITSVSGGSIIAAHLVLNWDRPAVRVYKHNHMLNQLMDAFAPGTHDLGTLTDMLENDLPAWTGEKPERVHTLKAPDLTGIQILQDSRVLDLRAGQPGAAHAGDEEPRAHIYRRLKVVKLRDNTGNDRFRVPLLLSSPKARVRFPPQQLPGKLRMTDVVSSSGGREECRWEASWDFRGVPPGDHVDLMVDQLSPGAYLGGGPNDTAIAFQAPVETAELTTWILMPSGKECRDFRITRREINKPGTIEAVPPVTEYLATDSTILAFKLLGLKPGRVYEVRWVYR